MPFASFRSSTYKHHFFPSLIVRSSANCAALASPSKRPPARGAPHPTKCTTSSRPSLSSSLLRPSRPPQQRAPSRASRPLDTFATGLALLRSYIFAVFSLVCSFPSAIMFGNMPLFCKSAPLFQCLSLSKTPFESPLCSTMLAF